MRVSAVMTSDPQTIRGSTGLDAAMLLMDEHKIRHLPIVEHGELVGVVSDRDLLEATGWLPSWRSGDASGFTPTETRCVRDVMHAPPVVVEPEDNVLRAFVDVLGRGIGCLPVVHAGRLLGIVTELDLLATYTSGRRNGSDRSVVDPPVSKRMSANPTYVEWFRSFDDALALCRSTGFRHLPVVEGDKLVGIVSDRDFRKAVGSHRHGETPIEEIMTKRVLTVVPETPLSAAAALMADHKISALPVVMDDLLVGILTSTDLLDHCLDALKGFEVSTSA